MRVITAQESKIRTTERTIKTGGTVIRHVSGFTASVMKKTGNAVKILMYSLTAGMMKKTEIIMLQKKKCLSFRTFWQKRAEHYMAP